MRTSAARNRGFTFLEMALALFIMGFILAAVPRVLDQTRQAMVAAPGATATDATALALNGFILANNRMPCPAATASSGTEDCTRTRGFVPHTTMGLPRPATGLDGFPLQYAIFEDQANGNRLGGAGAKYTPEYLNSTADYWLTPATLTSQRINGLDFCAKLRDAATRPAQTGLTGVKNASGPGGVNVAWVLADSGTTAVFEGGNSLAGSAWFESPSRPKSATYDDNVRVGTLPQVFGELHCASLLAGVTAAAREADYANDQLRIRRYLVALRNYELQVREQQVSQAEVRVGMAALGSAVGIASASITLGISLGTTSGAVSTALVVLPQAAAIAAAVAAVVLAALSLDKANGKVTEAQERLALATAALTSAEAFLAARRTALLSLDQRGWFQ
jgi:prepilin-type N-terminal cleavage/methylation domain-containing protein